MSEYLATVWVCVDCAFAEHGYDEREMGRPLPEPAEGTWFADDGWTVMDITPGLLWSEHAPDCEAYVPEGEDAPDDHVWNTGTFECECHMDSFSMHDCERCGSHLAGEREAFTVWGRGAA